MPPSPAILRSVRLFHLYSGVFFAPALLFFAFTGSVQSMNFHESTRGSSYKPPAILAKLAQLHKNQTLIFPERKAPLPAIQAAPVAPPSSPASAPSNVGDVANQQKLDTPHSGENVAGPATLTPPNNPEKKPQAAPAQRAPKTLPMKIFAFWAGVGLFLSTLSGLYMAYRYARSSKLITATLLAGAAVPAILLLLQ